MFSIHHYNINSQLVTHLSIFFILTMYFPNTIQQNATQPRNSGQHEDSNLMIAIQQIQRQLVAIESENQRHSTRMQEVLRATTRIETQRQELIATLDRTELRITQKLDDIKGETRRIITLQDVMREEVDKIGENQIMMKTWIDDLKQLSLQRSTNPRQTSQTEPSLLHINTEVLSNLQIVQSTLYSLRRMADSLQSNLSSIKLNLTDLINTTRDIQRFEESSLVTKNDLEISLQMLADEKATGECINPKSQDVEEILPKDCSEVQLNVQNKTGIYRIRMHHSARPIFVFCDMETDGGGWTVFQRREDGSMNFLRKWQDYKHGFGNVGGEFWLGNENLYLITHQDLYVLRIDLADFEGGEAFVIYDGFAVGNEKEKYTLKMLGFMTAGDAGDGLSYHAYVPFSTIDRDNDLWESGNCAQDHTGGWWYNSCDASNLNGQYLKGLNQKEYQGVYWHEWQGPSYSLMRSKMMIRPKGHKFAPTIKTPFEDIDIDDPSKPISIDF